MCVVCMSFFFIVRVPGAYDHFCCRWQNFFSRYTRCVSSLTKKLLWWALLCKWNMQRAYYYFFASYFLVVAVETTIECWTLIEFTKYFHFSFFAQKWIYQLNLYINWERFLVNKFAVSFVVEYEKRDQVLSKSSIWALFPSLRSILKMNFHVCCAHRLKLN